MRIFRLAPPGRWARMCEAMHANCMEMESVYAKFGRDGRHARAHHSDRYGGGWWRIVSTCDMPSRTPSSRGVVSWQFQRNAIKQQTVYTFDYWRCACVTQRSTAHRANLCDFSTSSCAQRDRLSLLRVEEEEHACIQPNSHSHATVRAMNLIWPLAPNGINIQMLFGPDRGSGLSTEGSQQTAGGTVVVGTPSAQHLMQSRVTKFTRTLDVKLIN